MKGGPVVEAAPAPKGQRKMSMDCTDYTVICDAGCDACQIDFAIGGNGLPGHSSCRPSACPSPSTHRMLVPSRGWCWVLLGGGSEYGVAHSAACAAEYEANGRGFECPSYLFEALVARAEGEIHEGSEFRDVADGLLREIICRNLPMPPAPMPPSGGHRW